jgi:hypothetical protein
MTEEEVSDLIGATIEDAWIEKSDDPYGMEEVLRMRVRFRKGLKINDHFLGEYEVWQDIEGNGPGLLAYQGPPPISGS